MNYEIIKTRQLKKIYKRYKKPEGLMGSITSLLKRDYEKSCRKSNLSIDKDKDITAKLLSAITMIIWKRGLKHYKSVRL